MIDVRQFSKQNNKYKYLLTIIDVYSKFAWVIPLKTKTGSELIEAFQKIMKIRKPKKLWTDLGKEFVNKQFKSFLAENNIELYHTFNEGKAVVIERFNRTLKERMWKKFTELSTTKYIDILPELVNNYNNTYHSTIKMTPTEGSDAKNKINYNYDIHISKPKFKIGDRVRIYKHKKQFEKGYETNWTREIFVVTKILFTSLITYRIKDLNDKEILGSFYKQEHNKSSL